ncbi:MAG TPA: toast rack family protein [Candidatus Acidoferrum sp.]|nr:toast rack family protein [Candidatus Acidoferrum sp.]
MAQDGNPRRVSLVFPIILIAVGALFLFHNWRPAFDPWPILATYWPLILIFIGIGKIWDTTYRSRNPNAPQGISIGATIGTLAFVIVLVVLLWHGRSYSRSHGYYSGSQHNTQTVDLQGAKSAHAKLELGAGQLTINGGANHMLDADFTYDGSFDAPRVDYSVSGGVGQLNISQESHSAHFGRSQNDWNLHFSKDIPLELKVDMGAGQGNLHFRDVPLTRLDLNIGAGQMDVDFTGDRKTDLTADIEGGVGQANIRLPKNVGVIAHASGGIGSIDVHGLKHDGDSYTNDAYGKSPATIHLKVEGGIGQITLTQEP